VIQRTQIASLRLFGPLIDAIVVAATYLLAMGVRSAFRIWWPYDLIPGQSETIQPLAADLHFDLLVLVIPIWVFFLRQQATYDLPRKNRTDLLFLRIVRAVTLATLALLATFFILGLSEGISRSLIVAFATLSCLTVFLARRLMIGVIRRLRRKGLDAHNIVVIGNPAEARPFIEKLNEHEDWGFRIMGVILPDGQEDLGPIPETVAVPNLGHLADINKILEKHPVHQVFLTGRAWKKEDLYTIADSCEELGVEFSMDANFLGLRVAKAELNDIEGWSVLSFTSTPSSAEALLLKRMMDMAFAGIGLVLLSPFLVLTALLIKIEDPKGGVFFGQERSGLYGRSFKMWKFRSMVSNAEALREELEAANEMDGPVFKITNDPRITRVGRFIRKTSIDELPQLWNVLAGDMSLVGPRPPIPTEVEKYKRWQMRRLSMRPGITCIWQVSGRNNIDFDTWMKLDLQYIDNWTLFLDIKLLLKTLPVVLLRRGAS
jgi:exopolysaccharide biosynthesis polyprenyl glycosylphosphotransferase